MATIPAGNDRVSRWTPAIFAIALGNFVLAELLIVAGTSWPTLPQAAGATLALVHLLTIGWITLLMFGALFQFVPVLTGRKLWSQCLALATLVLVEPGLAGMVGGFLLLGTNARFLLPAGGSAVILGLLAGILGLALPLAQKRPLPLSARFVIAGLTMLLLTVTLGVAFALGFTVPALAPVLGPLIATGLEYHALAGIGGWFTLTAIGVSYELLPMFMLAPHDRGAWGESVLWLAAAGFILALAVGLAGPHVFRVPGLVGEQLGRVLIAAAVALYLADVARMYRDRRRRLIELHNRAAVGAFLSLGAALVVAVAASLTDELAKAAPGLVFLLIFGWLGGLGLSQLYKIVPFLAWLFHFGRRLGGAPVPRVQDLVDERRAAPMFALYFGSVAIAAFAAFGGFPLLVRAAVGFALFGTLLLAREYRRAWRGYYVRQNPASNLHLSLSRTGGGA